MERQTTHKLLVLCNLFTLCTEGVTTVNFRVISAHNKGDIITSGSRVYNFLLEYYLRCGECTAKLGTCTFWNVNAGRITKNNIIDQERWTISSAGNEGHVIQQAGISQK